MSYEVQKISELPAITEVIKRSQGLALLDAIIMPEWQNRYFSFNCNWDQARNEMMASMRDGSGNEYFLHFSKTGVAGKVLYEKKLENASSLLLEVPECFSSFKNESAFTLESVTFFLWRRPEDNDWVALPHNLKSYALLGFLIGGSSYYHNWAENYYGKKINLDVLNEVFCSLTINSDLLKILNPEITIEELGDDVLEIFGNEYGHVT
jgi:hypothetical protein